MRQIGVTPNVTRCVALTVVIGSAFGLAGCNQPSADCPPPPSLPPKVAAAPSGPIVFQPMFEWEDGSTSFQGTGFFAFAPDGKVAAVTSAHFVDFDGPRLLRAHWESLSADDSLITFERCWGAPGNAGSDSPIDFREDYLLMPVEEGDRPHALVLDTRPQPALNERVWLPNKDYTEAVGYRLVEGTVIESCRGFSAVQLDEDIELSSQSGSPVISQHTGKVIGTLSRGSSHEGELIIFLAPAASVYQALESSERWRLQDVIGAERSNP